MYVKLLRLQLGNARPAFIPMATVRAFEGGMQVDGEITPLMQMSLDGLRMRFTEDARFLQAIVQDYVRSSYYRAELVQE